MCHPEHNARGELHEYARSESAAPNVHLGPPGNVLEKNFVENLLVTSALIKPSK